MKPLTEEQAKQLKEMAQPIADWLHTNFHPHATVTITDTFIKLSEDTIGIPARYHKKGE